MPLLPFVGVLHKLHEPAALASSRPQSGNSVAEVPRKLHHGAPCLVKDRFTVELPCRPSIPQLINCRRVVAGIAGCSHGVVTAINQSRLTPST